MEDEIYLDNNATTRPLAEVREAMLTALDEGYGNPSSEHSSVIGVAVQGRPV